MSEIASILLVISLWLVVIPRLWLELRNLRNWIIDEVKKMKYQKELKNEYCKWYDKAKSCDRFGGAVDKGMAIARLVIIKNEMEKTNKNE